MPYEFHEWEREPANQRLRHDRRDRMRPWQCVERVDAGNVSLSEDETSPEISDLLLSKRFVCIALQGYSINQFERSESGQLGRMGTRLNKCRLLRGPSVSSLVGTESKR